MKQLNERYLNHPWPTDVLAFPFDVQDRVHRSSAWSRPAQSKLTWLGEIIISTERARVHAKRFHAPLNEELVRYVCHGILHLSGYSDHTRRDRLKMRQAEERLLRFVRTEVKQVV